MPTPQLGIFKEGSNQFTFLEFKLKPNISAELIKSALKKIPNTALVAQVLGFGKSTWSLLGGDSPSYFNAYKGLKGVEGYEMPSTQQDIYFWLHSSDASDNFDRVQTIISNLSSVATCSVNQTGFTYHDNRDFIGFVDGSANPKEDKRYAAALIPESEIGAGGSIVFSQRWVHNLNKFEHVPVKEQEGIIGRTKTDNIELEGDDMPHNSHVSRTDLKLDGEALKIYRRSAPYVKGNESGLFFLSFASHTQRIQLQLESMLGITEDKVHDRLMEFSTAVTGGYWLAPSNESLTKLLE